MSEGFVPESDSGSDYVEFHPDAEKRTFLRAGKYGPGLEHPAECEITAYEMPGRGEHANPRYDKDGKRGPYAYLVIRVKSEEFGMTSIFHHEEIGSFAGSRLPRWLTNIGAPVGPPPGYGHNPKSVVGLKCAVEVGDHRTGDDGRQFTGRLLDVVGV